MVYYSIGVCARALLPLFFFFFNDTATTEIYTLSLHDALPISSSSSSRRRRSSFVRGDCLPETSSFVRDCRPEIRRLYRDRKSTRLNSSHLVISYAVFCLKKKKIKDTRTYIRNCHRSQRTTTRA